MFGEPISGCRKSGLLLKDNSFLMRPAFSTQEIPTKPRRVYISHSHERGLSHARCCRISPNSSPSSTGSSNADMHPRRCMQPSRDVGAARASPISGLPRMRLTRLDAKREMSTFPQMMIGWRLQYGQGVNLREIHRQACRTLALNRVNIVILQHNGAYLILLDHSELHLAHYIVSLAKKCKPILQDAFLLVRQILPLGSTILRLK